MSPEFIKWMTLFVALFWMYLLVEFLLCRLVRKIVKAYLIQRYETSTMLIAKEFQNAAKIKK